MLLISNTNENLNLNLNFEYNYDEKIYPLGLVDLKIFCRSNNKIRFYSIENNKGELNPSIATLNLEEFNNCDTLIIKISTLCIDANLIDSFGHPKRLLRGEKIFLGLTPKNNKINLKFKFLKDSMYITQVIH